MRKAIICYLAFLLVPTFSISCSSTTKIVPPIVDSGDIRVQPLVNVMKATSQSDIELFKSSFSRRVARRRTDQQAERALGSYKRQFKKELGNYKVKELRFKFTGNEKHGTVVIVQGSREAFNGKGLDVVKEGPTWKINER